MYVYTNKCSNLFLKIIIKDCGLSWLWYDVTLYYHGQRSMAVWLDRLHSFLISAFVPLFRCIRFSQFLNDGYLGDFQVFSSVLQTVLQWICLSICVQTIKSSCKINSQKWNYEARQYIFTFKCLIESDCLLQWLTVRGRDCTTFTACLPCSAGRCGQPKRVREGSLPSRSFHLVCVPSPRERLGCQCGWVGGCVSGWI